MEKKLSIIIAPTNACNLHCEYCYNHFNRQPVEISTRLLWSIIQKSFREYDYVDFVWRGGEPLLLSNRFYKRAFYLQHQASRKYGTVFHNSIQTNGTLLAKRRIKLFKRFRYEIGISFDGLENETHRSETEKTLSALSNCKKVGFPVGIITVVTTDSCNLVKQYKYLKSYTHNIRFAPCFETPFVDLSVNAEWYISELKGLFEYWLTDKEKTFISPLSEYIRHVLGVYRNRDCIHASCLGKMLDIDAEGTVRICSHVSDQCFSLGSFYDYNRIEDIFSCDKFNTILSTMVTKRQYCKENCPLFDFCQGGCCAECYLQKDKDNTFWCSVIRDVLPYIETRVKYILSNEESLSHYNPAFIELVQEAFCYNPMYLKKLSENKCQIK